MANHILQRNGSARPSYYPQWHSEDEAARSSRVRVVLILNCEKLSIFGGYTRNRSYFFLIVLSFFFWSSPTFHQYSTSKELTRYIYGFE
ncbi:hypothetical protein BT63DRAFT_157234 [Microthyrium microscopicum]|uniref:Uncharacterized protein n=1 Tax=Microthyrium microscopicum TaxID=703497 RepID=A0A6A6UPS7_9PEZI|nr:hypothetical protein BT63DRAFT_157234 [Microthyrium microscopicum]